MSSLAELTTHRVHLAFDPADRKKVEAFVAEFDPTGERLTAAATRLGDTTDRNALLARLRADTLADTSVTLVLIGTRTWAKSLIDVQIAATLYDPESADNATDFGRQPSPHHGGLFAITLPGIDHLVPTYLPQRFADNFHGKTGFARWFKYPDSVEELADMINIAESYRTSHNRFVHNKRPLQLKDLPA